jgi:hypothetical protein
MLSGMPELNRNSPKKPENKGFIAFKARIIVEFGIQTTKPDTLKFPVNKHLPPTKPDKIPFCQGWKVEPLLNKAYG